MHLWSNDGKVDNSTGGVWRVKKDSGRANGRCMGELRYKPLYKTPCGPRRGSFGMAFAGFAKKPGFDAYYRRSYLTFAPANLTPSLPW